MKIKAYGSTGAPPPKPTSGLLYIEAAEGLPFEVFDGFGKRRLSGVLDGQPFQVSSLPPGIYYLRVVEEVFKFIKS